MQTHSVYTVLTLQLLNLTIYFSPNNNNKLSISGSSPKMSNPSASPPDPEETASLTALLRETLPLLSLPTAVISHPTLTPPIRKALATLLANLHLLPPNLQATPTLPKPHLDQISTLLAQHAALSSEALLDVWNALSPAIYQTPSPSTLPFQISSTRARIAALKTDLNSLESILSRTRDAALRNYHAALRAVLHAAETDLTERGGDSCADAARTDVLSAKADATAGKLRLQRAELAREVYTVETVSALEKVLCEVERRESVAEIKLEELRMRLRAYERLGPGFGEIVKEYTQARRVLEEKVWSRDELIR